MRMPPRITKPSFFKVLLGDFAERLRIPPKFTKHILKEATRVAILQSRKGRYWKVEIRKNSQGTFLWNGWKKFVSDHSLREHDFLVFRYDGDMHFSVTIFDKSACEREYGPKTKLSKKRSISEGRDELTRPVKRDLDVGYLLQHNTTRKKWPQNLSKNMYQDHQGRIKRTPKPKKHAKITNDGDVSPIRVLAPDAKYTNDYSCHRLIAIHQEPSKALEAAKSFNSMFPYFVTRMTSSKVSNRYMLIIPSLFSREHLPRGRRNMVLQDPYGKAWEVSCIPVRRDRYLSKGWADFVRGNNLVEGDYCAFELHSSVIFRVTIFRAIDLGLSKCDDSYTIFTGTPSSEQNEDDPPRPMWEGMGSCL